MFHDVLELANVSEPGGVRHQFPGLLATLLAAASCASFVRAKAFLSHLLRKPFDFIKAIGCRPTLCLHTIQ